MILLILFAFIAGIVTILSPCILPILPIVLSGAVGGGKRKPLGVVIGFIGSFTFFTLFLTTIVNATGISADALRMFSVFLIAFFGLTLILPKAQELVERAFSRLSQFIPQTGQKDGFGGGVLIGLSLGLLWTPCVGPILASVISLALTGAVNGSAVVITLAYSFGTAIPLFAIMFGGRALLNRAPFLVSKGAVIQKIFGVLMILTAVAIFFNIDRQFQTAFLTRFPQYGVGLTKIEDNDLVKQQLNQMGGTSLRDAGPAPEFVKGGEWFNLPEGSTGLSIKELKGKVVLVDFWTYTCINCIRTLPYIESWYEKYKDQDFVVVGVHTPEFEFEKNPANVSKAIQDFMLTYPVMQDNQYATWRAYSNQYWPAKYLIDKDGVIRYAHFGEGKYDETEEAIQMLLRENGKNVQSEIDNFIYSISAQTPETYLGYARIARYTGTPAITNDKEVNYSAPALISTDNFAFSGPVMIGKEHARMGVNSKITLGFKAQDVFLVMRPTSKSAVVKVYLDGIYQKDITVDTDRLYELLKLETLGEHTVTIEFPEGAVEAFAFTFG